MKRIKMLVYSPPGYGKTTLTASLSENENLVPALVIDFEGGVEDAIGSKCKFITLQELKTYKPQPKELTVVRVKRWNEFEVLYDYITENKVFKTIVFDSLSEINFLNLSENTNAFETVAGRIANLKMPKIQNYGDSGYQMEIMVRAFRDLDCNVIAIAGARRDENEVTKEVKIYPNMVGQFRTKVGFIFSIVGYLNVWPGGKYGDVEYPEGTRVLRVHPSEKIDAKFRDEFRIVPPVIFNPSYPIILSYLNGVTPK